MRYLEYPEQTRTQLATQLRIEATRHQQTPLYWWDNALKLINPEILVKPPIVQARLEAVYDLLDVKTK